MSGGHRIELRNVSKRYEMGEDFFEALKEIELQAEAGEFLGFVGPSGSGKTTLLNLVGGLDEPSEGEVFVADRNLGEMNEDELSDFRNETIGFVFQTFNLLPVYTAFENVEFPLLLQPTFTQAQRKELVEAILAKVGLADKMYKMPNTLSGGECQRVAIARAMVKRPTIVLADEPTANLDSENSHEILKIMAQLNEEYGTTFLFSTHDEKVMRYLRRTIILTDGRITRDIPHVVGSGTHKDASAAHIAGAALANGAPPAGDAPSDSNTSPAGETPPAGDDDKAKE